MEALSNCTFSNVSGPVTTSFVVVGSNTQSSDNVQWNYNAWTCPSCGALVFNGAWHVCGQNQFQFPAAKPHRCPVCEGRARVTFDPDNPYARQSAVETWPCKPCNATGILWR